MESVITDTYAVHFNQRGYDAINDHLAAKGYSKIFVLVDENTKADCLPAFKTALQSAFEMEVLEAVSGEKNKVIETCVELWDALSSGNADRKSLLINLGGGVITDMGGFVASTFKRGIAFINVPTTLLAMVDASIGGKTGVDLGGLKNQIGVINQPEMVLVVSKFLNTLDDRQLRSGYAEMLKHGLISDGDYWNVLRSSLDFTNIDHHINTSVAIKNEVVLKDPTEQNIRKILNFGHTLGHAIESYFLEDKSLKTLLHGEAIAVGMILEAYLSHKLTGLSEEGLTDIKRTFLNIYPLITFTATAIDDILILLKFDKKNTHGNINFALLEAIGKPVIDIKVPHELFEDAFAYYALA